MTSAGAAMTTVSAWPPCMPTMWRASQYGLYLQNLHKITHISVKLLLCELRATKEITEQTEYMTTKQKQNKKYYNMATVLL